MASQNSTRDAELEEQKSRKDIDDIDWRDGEWPSTGRFRDVFWAHKHQMKVRSLRDMVYRLGIPFVPVGKVIYVDAEDMTTFLPKVHREPKKTRKPATLARKKRSDNGKS